MLNTYLHVHNNYAFFDTYIVVYNCNHFINYLIMLQLPQENAAATYAPSLQMWAYCTCSVRQLVQHMKSHTRQTFRAQVKSSVGTKFPCMRRGKPIHMEETWSDTDSLGVPQSADICFSTSILCSLKTSGPGFGSRKSQMRIESSWELLMIWKSSNCKRNTRPVCSCRDNRYCAQL